MLIVVPIHRFQKDLAAEALRRNENDTQKALDDLTNPETNSALQVSFHVYFFIEFLLNSNHSSPWFVE